MRYLILILLILLFICSGCQSDPVPITGHHDQIPLRFSQEPIKKKEQLPVLSRYETKFDPSIPRAKNVILAANRLDFQTIPPSSELSFNSVVGPRTKKAGFVAAPQYFLGTLQEGIGGGVCQVSSTLYAAAMFGGLEVKRRYMHSRPVSYLPRGMDATVSFPDIDLIIRNPYDSILVLRTSTEKGLLQIRFLGKVPSLEVEFQYVGNNAISFPRQEIKSKYVKKPKLYQKGKIGYPGTSTWIYYRDNMEIKRVVVPNRYRPVPEIWIVPN